MLHMIVNTHNPESCAFRSRSDGAALSEPFDHLVDNVAGAHGIAIQGTWVNRLSHEVFILADAPNSHVIEEALLEAGLVGRTHSRVLSVVPTQEVQVDPEE
jgi:hypothetical protein